MAKRKKVYTGEQAAAEPAGLMDTTGHFDAFRQALHDFADQGFRFTDQLALRKTQRDSFTGYMKGVDAGHMHGLFDLPTGIGKTPLFTAISNSFIKAEAKKPADEPRKRVLVLVPLDRLGRQAISNYGVFAPELRCFHSKDKKDPIPADTDVVVTSYQAVAMDKDHSRFPPEQYGMVIYDEGHGITADEWGKAVKTYQQSVQLAVTATPEYDEDKSVINLLPYCYHKVELKEVVGKELANAVPVLLKTNTFIDKQKFEEFVQAQNGRALSDDQIAALINTQSRNQAVMDLYLKGDNERGWESHLGENGLIFCANNRHAGDLERQMHNLLNDPHYVAEREWLDGENIELIAAVHSGLSSEKLDRKTQKGGWLKAGLYEKDAVNKRPSRGGTAEQPKEQFYSEDEIFDLHNQGKILLLAAVKKIREGYDCKRDSFIADLPDRLSKVAKTQIVGRGLRLNEGEPHFDTTDPPVVNKECTLVDVIDQNTFELFEDNPQMLPIHSAEVLAGAEFRGRMSRKHLLTNSKFKKPPPNMDESFASAGFEVISEIDRVITESTRNATRRLEATQYIPKPDDCMSGLELGLAIQQRKTSITNPRSTGGFIVNELRKEVTRKGTGSYFGVEVGPDDIMMYGYLNSPGYALRATKGQAIAEAYENSLVKPDGYLSSTEMDAAITAVRPDLGGNSQHIMKSLRDQFTADPDLEYATFKRVRVPPEAIAEYEYNTKTAYALRQAEADAIVQAYVEERLLPAGVWSSAQLGEEIQKAAPEIRNGKATGGNIIKVLRTQHEANRAAQPAIELEKNIATYKDVDVSENGIVTYDSCGQDAYGIRAEYGQQIVDAYRNQERLPEGYWTSNMLGKAIGKIKPKLKEPETLGTAIFSILRKGLAKEGARSATYKHVAVFPEEFREYDGRSSMGYALAEEKCLQIVAAYAAEKDIPDGYLSTEQFGTLMEANPIVKDGHGQAKRIMRDIHEQHKKAGEAHKDAGASGNAEASMTEASVPEVEAVAFTVPVPKSAIAEYTVKGKPAYSIRQAEAEAISVNVAKSLTEGQMQEGHISASDFGRILQRVAGFITEPTTVGRKAILAISGQFNDTTGVADYRGVKIQRNATGTYKYNNQDTVSIHKGAAVDIAEAMLRERGEQSPRAKAEALVTEITTPKIVATPRDVIPTSAVAKRE